MWFKCFQFYWKSLFGDHPWNAVHYVNLFLIESVKNIYIQYITNFQCYSTVTMWLSELLLYSVTVATLFFRFAILSLSLTYHILSQNCDFLTADNKKLWLNLNCDCQNCYFVSHKIILYLEIVTFSQLWLSQLWFYISKLIVTVKFVILCLTI